MRLIDADALETYEVIEPIGNGMYECAQVVYKDDIDNAPTIDPKHNSDDERKIADLHKMVNYLLSRLEQPESFDDKLEEIADALSEKMCYMNTCLNERDTILGYLGVKRRCETHCNTDCTNTKCESHPSFAQPEQRWIPCSERLPEIDELVLVTDDSGGVKTVDVDRCGQYECSEKRFWYYTQNVVAWMPLPDPWKEGEAE